METLFDLANEEKERAELEERTHAADFYDDMQAAQGVLKKVKILEPAIVEVMSNAEAATNMSGVSVRIRKSLDRYCFAESAPLEIFSVHM